jgi:UDP-glucose 4-epimerase
MKPQNFFPRIERISSYLEQSKIRASLGGYYDGKCILVTGGGGAIGSNLIIALSELVGNTGKIIVLDDFSATKDNSDWNAPGLHNVMIVKGSITDEGALARCFRNDISIVFHLAAFFANQNSIDYPLEAARVDITGLIKILELSTIAKVDRFVYASSGCAIYGSYPVLPLSEDFISMHLTTPYQLNKMTGEMYCNFYKHHYGLATVNCRFFNSFGPGEIPGQYRNVIPNFLYWSLCSESLPITGDGSETRDFTSVYDLVQGLLRSGFDVAAIGENFNLAAGREIAIVDMASAVQNATNSDKGIRHLERRKWDTKPRILASIEKANTLIGYKPIMSFESGLSDNVDWFNENWEALQTLADFPPGMNSALTKSGK